jgi:hypothetical protein
LQSSTNLIATSSVLIFPPSFWFIFRYRTAPSIYSVVQFFSPTT